MKKLLKVFFQRKAHSRLAGESEPVLSTRHSGCSEEKLNTENGVILSRAKDLIFSTLPKYVIGNAMKNLTVSTLLKRPMSTKEEPFVARDTVEWNKNSSPSRRASKKRKIRRPASGMILPLQRCSKPIAAFFFITFLCSFLLPNIAYALTSGPTAPEYTSFEPVDTNQMVDMNTGDFTYNLPILEVPGPAGGYPLSLSYHAGIRPDEEASWVGLGWTLNAGAINRSISGYPDDWKDEESFLRQFWSGGKTDIKRYGVGISFNVGPITLSVGQGITTYEDTYRGSMIGHDFSGGVGVGIGKSPFNVGASYSVNYDPFYGNSISHSHGIGASSKGEGASVGADLSFTSVYTAQGTKSGVGLSGGVRVGKSTRSTNKGFGMSYGGSLMGASISSFDGQTSVSTSAMGITSRSSSLHTSGKIWSRTKTKFNFSFMLQYRNQVNSYGMDEHQNDLVNGALYLEDGTYQDAGDYDNRDFDVYDLMELKDDQNTGDLMYPKYGLGYERMMGGSVASYDSYHVTAQGLAGGIQPYNYLSTLKRQNKKNEWDHYKLKQYLGAIEDNDPNEKMAFEFVGGFSNKYLYDTNDSRTMSSSGSNPITYSFSDSEIVADPDVDIGKTNNDLLKREGVEWLTNAEIINSRLAGPPDPYNPLRVDLHGLPDDDFAGFERSAAPQNQIGAFVVTNASGMKYFYGLPVYASQEVDKQHNINQLEEGEIFNLTQKNAKYAYTWLLTGVVGPDYVDYNGDGILNEGDWGYWVKFDYGKWTDSYKWRTPGTGYRTDWDSEFESAEAGVKELYYLDAIQTATHTALFVKEMREDAHSVSMSEELLYNAKLIEEAVYSPDEFEDSSFEDTELTCEFTYGYNVDFYTEERENEIHFNPVTQYDYTSGQNNPFFSAVKSFRINYEKVPSLKLTKIVLLKNEELVSAGGINKIRSLEPNQNASVGYEYLGCSSTNSSLCSELDEEIDPEGITKLGLTDVLGLIPDYWYTGANVIDVDDVANTSLESNSVKVIDFETDYSLAPNTTNSFDYNGNSSGKLTLNAIDIEGKGGVSLLPKVRFEYDFDSDDAYETTISGATTIFGITYGIELTSDGSFQNGDILKVVGDTGVENYFLYNEHNDYLSAFQGSFLEVGDVVTVSKTKNPPGNEEKRDYWGYYKSDYNSAEEDMNAHYRTTEISSKSTDVWSLRKINSPLGSEINIDYSSDDYSDIVIDNKVNYRITRMANHDDEEGWSLPADYFRVEMDNIGDLQNYFDVGQDVESFYVVADAETRRYASLTCNPDPRNFRLNELKHYYNSFEILEVHSDYILVKASNLILTTGESTGMPDHELPYYDNKSGADNAEDVGDYCGCSFNDGSDGETFYYKDVVGGEIYADPLDYEVGGGIKVDKISVTANNEQHEQIYEYEASGKSSGQTSSAPFYVNAFKMDYPDHYYPHVYGWYTGGVDDYDVCTGGNWWSIVTNNLPQILLGPTVVYLLEEEFDYSIPFTEVEINKLLGMDISSKEDFVRYKQQEVWGEFMTKSKLSPPGVKYSRVTVREKLIKDGEEHPKQSYMVYEYNEDDPRYYEIASIGAKDVSYDFNTTAGDGTMYEDAYKRRVALNTIGGIPGSLRKVTHYGTDGALSATDYKYLHDEVAGADFFKEYASLMEDRFGSQGVITEMFASGKYIPKEEHENDDGELYYDFDVQGQILKRTTYPMIQLGVVQTDYKTGMTSESYSEAFDYYSGEVVKSTAIDVDGISTSSETIPAYNVYEDMGPGQANMLTQTAATYTYKVNPNNTDQREALIGAGIQTWDNNWDYVQADGTMESAIDPVWRKHRSFTYLGTGGNVEASADGLMPYTSNSHPSFNAWNKGEVASVDWLQNNEITLYDHHSHALEVTDVNGNYAATKMDSRNEKVLHTIANAGYGEFAYSGAEDELIDSYFGGGVRKAAGVIMTLDPDESNASERAKVHTGLSSLALSANQNGFEYTAVALQDRPFKVSFWTDQDDVQLRYEVNEGSTAVRSGDELRIRDVANSNWKQVSYTIDEIPRGAELRVWCRAISDDTHVDDFRVSPLDAVMTAYVYNEYDELTYVLDNNNLFTRYEYDEMGRLKSITRETLSHGPVKVSETEMNYIGK